MTERRRVQPEDLLAFRTAGDVTLAPTGDRVAYTETWVNKEKNEYNSRVWVTGPDRRPVPLTAGPRDSSPRFSPDGRYLAFVRKQEEGSAQIWLLPLQGGEARQLTRIKGGCTNPVWSPDGRQLAFVAKVAPEGLQPDVKAPEETDLYKKFNQDVKVITRIWYKHDNIGFFDEKRAQIGIVDVADPTAAPCYPAAQAAGACAGPAAAAPPRLLTSGATNHADPAFSPDGKTVAFIANRQPDADWNPGVHDLWVVPAAGGEPSCLTDGTHGCSGPAFSPDGTAIACLREDPAESGYGTTDIALIPAAGGALRNLTAATDLTFSDESSKDIAVPGGNALTWSAAGDALYSLCSRHGTVHLVRVGLSGAVTPVTDGDRVICSYDLQGEGCFAYAVATVTDPSQIMAQGMGGAPGEVQLTDVNGALLAELELATAERFRFRAPEQVGAAELGPEVDGWIMRPVGFEAGQHYPAILQIRGGPMAMYASRFFFEFQEYCARGYAVIFTNPRGSTGYGAEFCRCIRADWGNRDYADCIAGVDAAITRFPFIDTARLGVAGGSYGGFMVNWIIGHTDRFACAVTMRSVVNRMSAMGTSDTGYDRVRQYGPLWWEDPAPYLQQSPIMWASHITTPLLIEHQEGDLRCPIDQAEQLYAALMVQKKEVKFIRYPGEFHEMSRSGKPWHRVHRIANNAEWMDQHLKG